MSRVRTIARDVDPSLRLGGLLPLSESVAAEMRPLRALFLGLLVTGALALLLSNAGIYSAMSFAVSRRTREIGVRVALGADRHRVVGAVLGRSMIHVLAGVLAGGVVLLGIALVASEFRVFSQISERGRSAEVIGGSVAYLVLMLGVCGISSVVPARRALAIEPTEALKAEA
jgi:ABC-type antimicrobial peptide transport system permease subunit